MSEIRTWWRLSAFGALLLTGVLVVIFVPMPDVAQVRSWAGDSGMWFPLLFGLGYVVATLLLVPRTLLSAMAGLVFSLTSGLVLVWVSALVGAIAGFWIGRWLGRDGVARLAGRHLDRLDDLVVRHGVFAVLTARLAPMVPCAAVNYGSGLTAVRFWPYTLATAIGIVPGTVVYVGLGSYAAHLDNWWLVLFAGALLGLTAAGGVYAKRRESPTSRTT
ncbi:MAG: TVP38/TMEM64 family protein [Kineosporiaceae bacterium]|nr:TVP38/TMEM64 family protein [Kineosporiaceae bacterium]MBK8077274.1 TVP38/TMEM64 family protein [Kineosporiaceae bacterium]